MRPAGEVKDKKETKGQDQGKNSVKSTFRNLQVRIEISKASRLTLIACSFVVKVWRLPLYSQTGELFNGMTLCFAAKEKKQKSKFYCDIITP